MNYKSRFLLLFVVLFAVSGCGISKTIIIKENIQSSQPIARIAILPAGDNRFITSTTGVKLAGAICRNLQLHGFTVLDPVSDKVSAGYHADWLIVFDDRQVAYFVFGQ